MHRLEAVADRVEQDQLMNSNLPEADFWPGMTSGKFGATVDAGYGGKCCFAAAVLESSLVAKWRVARHHAGQFEPLLLLAHPPEPIFEPCK
jgi:hypothetical protein